MALAVPTTIPAWAGLGPRPVNTYVVPGMRWTNGGNIYQVHAVTGGGTTSSGAGYIGTGTNQADGTAHVDYIGPVAPAWTSGTYVAGQSFTNAGSTFQIFQAGPGASTVAPTYAGPPAPTQFSTSDGYVWVWTAASSAQLTIPTAYQQDTGWLPGMKPPAQIMNWLFYWIYQWILWLSELSGSAYGSIFGPGTGPANMVVPPGDATHDGAYIFLDDYSTDGAAANMTTPTHASGYVTVNRAGTYKVSFDAQGHADTAGSYTIGVVACVVGNQPTPGNANNGPDMPREAMTTWDSTNTDAFQTSIHAEGFVVCAVGDRVGVYMNQLDYTHAGNVSTTLTMMRLSVQLVAPS